MQAVLEIADLASDGLAASAQFHADHLENARDLLLRVETSALAIVMPHAGHDHDDWRRTLGRDLARAYTPKRVNVVGASDPSARQELIAYLEGAPGVTGQYLAAHE